MLIDFLAEIICIFSLAFIFFSLRKPTSSSLKNGGYFKTAKSDSSSIPLKYLVIDSSRKDFSLQLHRQLH